MSGALTPPDGGQPFVGPTDNPLQKYFDQVASLHGFTPNALSQVPAPAPVGTEYVTSMGMPSQADDPVAYMSGAQPVMRSDLDRAHNALQTAMSVAPTMVLGMTGGEAPADSPAVQQEQ